MMKPQRIRQIFILACLAGMPALLYAQDGRPEEQEEQKLIALLQSDAGVFDKARACQRLAVIGTGRAVPALAALLDDEKLGDYARFGLEPISDPAVDAALRQALDKLDGRSRIGVINSIGARRDPEAVHALAKLAASGEEGATEALTALGRIATDEAARALSRALTEGPDKCRPAAAHACLMAAQRLAANDKPEGAKALCNAIRKSGPADLRPAATCQVILISGEAGVPLLIDLLKSDDAEMVSVALRAARELPGDEATRALAAQLDTLPAGVQVPLIKVLVNREDASVSGQLEALAVDGAPAVRVEALTALGEIGKASAVSVLLNAASGGGDVQDAARSSLRSIEGEGVDVAIIRTMKGAGEELRSELISVLADRGCTAAVPDLLEQASSDDGDVAKAAFKALGVLASPKELPTVIQLLTRANGARAASETAVVSIAGRVVDASKRTEPVLAALEGAVGGASRAALLRVLGRLGGEKAYLAITEAIDDKDAVVKDAAVRALAAWPDVRAADALLALVRDTDSKVHRVLALRGYVRLLGKGADRDARDTVGKYAEAMSMARTPASKKLVLGGLGGVPHRDALELAMKQLDDAAVRTEAGLAAVKIAPTAMAVDREGTRAAMEKLLDVCKSKAVITKARGVIRQIDKLADSITAWRVAGPYSRDGKDYAQLFDIVFEPEKPEPEDVEWRRLPAGTDSKRPWMLDLLKAIGGTQRVAYALTWVHSDIDQPARLELGSDDGVKAWLNGRLVHANNTARAAEAYTDKADIKLHAGWNPLLLKVTQNVLPWEFCARICGRDGRRLGNIRVDVEHEGDWTCTEER